MTKPTDGSKYGDRQTMKQRVISNAVSILLSIGRRPSRLQRRNIIMTALARFFYGGGEA